jgi:hypothetical protein
MKTIFALLGGLWLVSKATGYAIDTVIANIKYSVSKVKATFTTSNKVDVRVIVMIENNNPFPLDFKDFNGSIWYGDIVFNENGQPTNQAGIKIANVSINDFQQINAKEIGAVVLDFQIDISQTISQTVSLVSNGMIGISTVVKLYGEIGLFSTGYTGKITYPIIVPINLLNS